jgi:Tol biopolymer transport system component
LRTGGYSARTVTTRGGFAVRVTGPRGGERTFGSVPGCRDDGGLVAAVDSLQPTADGRSVVYATNCQEPYANLYAVSPDGGAPTRLTNVQDEQGAAALSPDGSKLAYIQAPFTGLSCKGCPSTLWVANAGGSHPVELTHLPFCMFDASPSWSPDGSRIVFARSGCDDNEPPHLDTIAPTGGGVAELGVAAVSVAWGPKRIAYIATGTGGLWTALPDGTEPQHVTGGRNPSAFSWSPDGRLAFAIREADGRIRLGIFDGVTTSWLATPFVGLSSLAWSPDGTRLAVAARPKGAATFDVFRLRANGSDVRRLTTNVDATSVSWGRAG